MLKHKTSVLFVDTNGKGKRAVQVPTTILLNWKKYLIVAGMMFLGLGLVIAFFIYENTSKYYTNIYQERLARANQIKNAIDIDKAKQSFSSINESMERINRFMEDRGLSPLVTENAGGPIEFEVTDINEVAELYVDEIKKMEALIHDTPIGKPHDGEQTSHFGIRRNPFGGGSIEGHKGIDLRGEIGDPVKTTAGGTVEFAGVKGGYGNCVIVRHKNDFKTLYGHLSDIHVRERQKVKSGEVIGSLGNTGRSTGPHLHYEIIQNDEKINPQNFLNL
jgi:murein DD-endopeptidase MepM/ murein hydrolase activator NlpD